MAAAKDEPQSKFEEASTTLSEGLETCRVVVGTYRELLGGDQSKLGVENTVTPTGNTIVSAAPVKTIKYRKPADFTPGRR